MECKHELKYLRGTADGVICTNCGMRWVGGDFPAMNPPESTADATLVRETPEKPKRTRRKKNA